MALTVARIPTDCPGLGYHRGSVPWLEVDARLPVVHNEKEIVTSPSGPWLRNVTTNASPSQRRLDTASSVRLGNFTAIRQKFEFRLEWLAAVKHYGEMTRDTRLVVLDPQHTTLYGRSDGRAQSGGLYSTSIRPRNRASVARSLSFFGGAVSPEHVHQRVVRFVARIFVDAAWRPRHGQFTFPRLRKCRRIVDLELVEQGIGVEKTKPLDQMQIPIPAEVPPASP